MSSQLSFTVFQTFRVTSRVGSTAPAQRTVWLSLEFQRGWDLVGQALVTFLRDVTVARDRLVVLVVVDWVVALWRCPGDRCGVVYLSGINIGLG